MKRRKVGFYAMYKGDEFIDLGTIPDLAKKYHVREDNLRYRATKTYRRRVKHGTMLIRIEDEKNDD